MAFKAFDRVKVKAGARVFSNERPLGLIVSSSYEVQIIRVVSADLSPDGFGEVLAWRVPGAIKDEDQHWTASSGVDLLSPVGSP